MMMRLLRFLFGLLIVPLCVAVTCAVLELLKGSQSAGAFLNAPAFSFLAGCAVWMFIWIFLPTPVRTYVLAHELTHALWGLLFGSRIRDLKIHPQGGSVKLSKTNVWITLAPYFFPFYTMLAILIRFLAVSCFGLHDYPLVWLFIVGITWMFHITFTIQSMAIRQPDIDEYGVCFSFVLIYLLNVIGVGIWIVCSTSATLVVFFQAILASSHNTYAWTLMWLCKIVQWLGAFNR